MSNSTVDDAIKEKYDQARNKHDRMKTPKIERRKFLGLTSSDDQRKFPKCTVRG